MIKYVIGSGFIGDSYAQHKDVCSISVREKLGKSLNIKENSDVLFAAGVTRLTRNDKSLLEYAKTLFTWVLEELNKAKPRHLILLSTIDVYGNDPGTIGDVLAVNPADYYSESQLLMEQMALAGMSSEASISILRLTGVYGLLDRQTSIISKFFTAAFNDKLVPVINDGLQLRDWIWIEDLMFQIDAAFASRESGIFNVGTGASQTVMRYAEIVAELTGAQIIKIMKEADTKRAADVVIGANLFLERLGVPFRGHKESLEKYHCQLLGTVMPDKKII